MDKICITPFKKLEIAWDGKVYTCCPSFIKYNYIGNILDENVVSLNDIWNSEKAQIIRKNILENNYSLCDLDICREKYLEEKKAQYTTNIPLPEYVTLAYDKACNIQCITCRDKKIKSCESDIEVYNKKLDSVLLPLLNSAKIITITGSGEAFYSKHSRELIKKLTKQNKDVKFHIYTNGLLFNEKNCKHLGLENRVDKVCFSIHALNEEIYNKIMVGSNLNVVLQNLRWASKQEKSGNIGTVVINTVISALNYKDMPKLYELAKELDVFLCFSPYIPWGTALDERYKELAVWENTNPLHNDFLKTLEIVNNIDDWKCIIPPIFQKL